MNAEQFKKQHPQAAAELALEERKRVLMHLSMGTVLDAPAVANEEIRKGSSLTESMDRYLRVAGEQKKYAEFEGFINEHGLMPAARIAMASGTRGKGERSSREDAVSRGIDAYLAREGHTEDARDLGEKVADQLMAERKGYATPEDAAAAGVDLFLSRSPRGTGE
ncbi:MAG TPA: hypothetical protein VH062_06630 [Polyangiaceae bacterium]|jgi:SpoVK/Ycf46/Vps4 family AAA+-type ATPase|nr:hypothetical protein [Polyangiaceae bacterium]